MLFVENTTKKIDLIYKGKMFFSATEVTTRNFINRLFTKIKTEKQLERYLDEIIRLENFGKNLNAIRLTELELQEWIQVVRRLGGDVRDFRESKEILEIFSKNNTGAAFQADGIPPTIWIRKGDVSDLEMFYECMHFEDFLRRGKTAYTRGHPRKILSLGNLSPIPERDQLISKFIKEKYVLDKVIEEQERWVKVYGKGRWTQLEIDESIDYFDRFVKKINKFNKKSAGKNFIDIDKITIK